MYVFENPNPDGIFTGDCVVRAIAIAEGKDWDTIYIELALQGLLLKDMPSSNRVWMQYLKNKGYERKSIYDCCDGCYTVSDFCEDFPKGTFILGTGTHAVAVIDGNWRDSWDSGKESPAFYFERSEK